MSGLTVEDQVKSENGIKYTIHIRDFDQRTKSFRSGRYIYSKDFWIGDSAFCVHIFPNGETTEDEGHVGVYLNIARSRKAALRNLIGFGGVKLFLLKNVTTTTVTTAIVTNVTHTTVTITTVTVSTDTTVTITTVTTVTITTVLSCVII